MCDGVWCLRVRDVQVLRRRRAVQSVQVQMVRCASSRGEARRRVCSSAAGAGWPRRSRWAACCVCREGVPPGRGNGRCWLMRGAEFPYGWASRSCSGDEGGAGGSCLPVREARARCSLIGSGREPSSAADGRAGQGCSRCSPLPQGTTLIILPLAGPQVPPRSETCSLSAIRHSG